MPFGRVHAGHRAGGLRHLGNEQSGSVDVLAMLNWLVAHGYLPKNSGLSLIGYGWEICSTGGQNEIFQVSNFSITATR